jgi:DNA-binding CsgD family transcriptional regulator
MSARGTPYATYPSQDHRDRVPEAVRVRLLGGFSVSVGTRTIRQDEWRSKKAAALAKLLALAPGHRMHREQAIDLLWPDSARSRTSNNLRQVVYGARRVRAPDSGSPKRYLGLQGKQLVLCPEGQLWVDAEAFEDARATARRSRDPSAYRAALELYAGELLPEDRYEEWAEGRPDASANPLPLVSTTDEPTSNLTRREREVATLVSRGLTNRQVATELSISDRTAANHMARILHKLGLSTRAQIASWATQR